MPRQFELKNIEGGERFELLCSELLKSSGFKIVRPPSRGPDRGVDIIATSTTTDDLGFELDVRIAVECKHFAASGRSVTEAAVGNIVERTLSHNCNRYLLITSTIPSSSLAHQIEGINNNPSIPLRAAVWNEADIKRLLRKFPAIETRFSAREERDKIPTEIAKGVSEDTAGRLIIVHLHPDFQDELLQLIDVWNKSQSALRFVPVRPPRELENKLLKNKPISIEEVRSVARELRLQAGFENRDGIIQFCEGRLHGDDTYQLFAITWRLNRGHLSESTISLRMMRILVDEGHIPKAPVFTLIVRQLLSVLGHDSGLESHPITRGCPMDYCEEMSDIQIGLKSGPKFCPKCEALLAQNKASHLLKLAIATGEFVSQGKDDRVKKRMKLRDERQEIIDASGTHDRQATSPELFDVALSFAGEDRATASTLANALKNRGLNVFYDDFQKSKLWGADLYSYLSDLYRFRATYCVMFISKHYAKKVWTNHERAAAQERAFRDNRTYILPIRLDDAEIPGVLSTVGYLRWDDEEPDSVADMILDKLADKKANGSRSTRSAKRSK